MNVVFLVPRRADGGYRDSVWGWVKARLAAEHPDWPIHDGHHDDGPFNRSAAINTAARDAGDWDVAVIADADSFVDADRLRAAVDLAASSGQMVLAYDRFCYLNQQMTEAVLGGFLGDWFPGVEWTMTGTCSSMVVVTRKLWDRCGGFDEGFDSGWGGEDVGFSLAAQTYGGGLQRTPGDVWHLYHVPSTDRQDRSWAERIKRYEPAAYDVRKMTALLKKLRAELVAT